MSRSSKALLGGWGVIVLLIATAASLIVRLPNRAECVSTGRVVDPTLRHCLGPNGYTQLQEHVTMHAIEAVVACLLICIPAFAVLRWMRRRRVRATHVAVVLALVAQSALAQSVTKRHPLDGVWRGTSICTPVGKPRCHDEVVVYYFKVLAPLKGQRDSVEWTANKIVNGKEEDMGTLTCTFDRARSTIQCPMRGWTWDATVSSDSIRGMLRNPSGVVWRNIRAVRNR